MPRPLHFTAGQRRSFISSLFGFTFLASVVTVSASAVLPCPAHRSRMRIAEGEIVDMLDAERKMTVHKRSRKWIEEKTPTAER